MAKPKAVSPIERAGLEHEFRIKMLRGELTPGQGLRFIRKQLLRLSRDQYSEYCRISKELLKRIEKDDDSVSLRDIKKALEPLGYSLSLVSQAEIPECLIEEYQQDHPSNPPRKGDKSLEA